MTATLIDRIESGKILARADAEALMEELLSGALGTAQIVRLLTALNARPVRVEELTGFASVMRRHAAPVFVNGQPRPDYLVDTCGTGGKNCATFNISTAAAIVAAGAGAHVAKHGNRSFTSRCGSADVLERLGVRIDLPAGRVGEAIRQIGIGFLFAQSAHKAARHAAPARKEIGVRTVFNLLGPLTNPAGARAQVLGVSSAEAVDLVSATLRELGSDHAFVVHGDGGLDEIALSGETLVAEVKGGAVRRFTVAPEDFGVARAPLGTVLGGAPEDNAAAIRSILEGEAGPRRDIVLVNAAASLVAAGRAADFREGAAQASAALASGAAREKLAALISFTQDEFSSAQESVDTASH